MVVMSRSFVVLSLCSLFYTFSVYADPEIPTPEQLQVPNAPTSSTLPTIRQQQQELIEQNQQQSRQDKLVDELQVEQQQQQAQIENSLSFVLQGITIKGNKTLDNQLLKQLVAPYIKQSVNSATLKVIANKITGLLVNQGFGTSKAFVPPQQVRNGVVEIQVEEDKLAKIQVYGENSFKYNDDLFYQYFADLQGKIIHLPTLQQRLRYLTFLPSAKITPTLKKAEFGQSILFLKLQERASFSNVSFSSNAGRYNGDYRVTGVTSFTNPTGRGDTVSAFVTVNPESPKFFSSIFTQYALPFGSEGAKLNLNYSSIDYQFDPDVLGEASQFLMYKGQSEQVSAYYEKPVLLDYGNFSFKLGLERRASASQEINLYIDPAQSQSFVYTVIDGVLVQTDRFALNTVAAGFKTRDQQETIYTANMSLSSLWTDKWSGEQYPAQNSVTVSYAKALEGMWGSLTQEDIDLKTINTDAAISPQTGPVGNSRGAIANFWKLYFSYTRLQLLPWQTILTLNLNYEFTEFDNLPSSYKYGGADSGTNGGDYKISLSRQFEFARYLHTMNIELGYKKQIAINTLIPDENFDDGRVQTCGGLSDLVVWEEYSCSVSSPYITAKFRSNEHYLSLSYVTQREKFESQDKKLSVVYSYSF